MFKELYTKMADGDTVTLSITRKNDLLTVSLLPSSKVKGIVPVVIKGTADEIDNEFLTLINPIMDKVKEKFAVAIVNEEEVNKSIEEAKISKDNTPRKSKTVVPVKATPAKPVDVLAKAKQLITEKKYDDAIQEINTQLAAKSISKASSEEGKVLLYNARLEKQKALFDTPDESDEVIIPKKITPNPAVAEIKAAPAPEPELEEEVLEEEDELKDEFSDVDDDTEEAIEDDEF